MILEWKRAASAAERGRSGRTSQTVTVRKRKGAAMSSSKSHFDKPRLNQLFDDLNSTLKDFIREHHVTYAEFHQALHFLSEVGEKGETPLLFDVFLESTVDVVNN